MRASVRRGVPSYRADGQPARRREPRERSICINRAHPVLRCYGLVHVFLGKQCVFPEKMVRETNEEGPPPFGPVGVNPGVSLERGRLATPRPFGVLACRLPRWTVVRYPDPNPSPANFGGPVLRECALPAFRPRFRVVRATGRGRRSGRALPSSPLGEE